MKFKSIFVITYLFISFCYGQTYDSSMRVLKPELSTLTYEKDSTANAVIVYDYGNSYFDRKTFRLVFQLKQKIKILSSEGLERGVIKIRLYKGKSSSESIKNIKGATYNLENGVIAKTELTKKSIFKEENDDYTLVKIAMPKVKVGSIITINYETSSRFIAKYQPWYFQGADPVIYSEYNTSIPANYEYHIKLVGNIPLAVNDSKLELNCLEVSRGGSADCTVSKYVMKDIPAYKEEAFTTTSLNYTSRIEYELSIIRGFDGSIDRITNTWEYADNELKSSKDFGKQLYRKNLVKIILPQDITTTNDKLLKAQKIYNYVLDHFKWNKKFDRFNVSVKSIVENKIGNAFEINFLLLNLLYKEGYEVYPILLSTRSSGLPTKLYPVLTEFNYSIIKVNIEDNAYFLDATNPYLSFGEIPFRCLNQYGRLIDFDEGSYWIDIKPSKYSVRQHSIELNNISESNISGRLLSQFSGYHAHDLKQRFDENPETYRNYKAEIYQNLEIDNIEVKDFNKHEFQYTENINFNYKPELIGNKIYLNPFLFLFFEDNPFKLQERSYPIDFGYKDSYIYILNFKLGDDFKITELPKSLNYSLPNKTGYLTCNFEQKENTVNLFFKIKFNKAIYNSGYYKYLKIFMDKVIETQKNSLIVLEKQ